MQKIFLKLFLLLAFIMTSVFSINYTYSLESSYFHKQVAERIYEKIENRYKNKTEIEKLIIYEVLSKKLDELILKVKDQDIKEVVKILKTYLTWESSIENPPIVGDPHPPIAVNPPQNPPVVNSPPTQNPPKDKKKLCPHNGWYEPNFCLIKWKPIWKVKEYYVSSITWTKYSKIKKWSYTWKQAENYCKSLWKGWRLPRNIDFYIVPKLAYVIWINEKTLLDIITIRADSSILNIPPHLVKLVENNSYYRPEAPLLRYKDSNAIFIKEFLYYRIFWSVISPMFARGEGTTGSYLSWDTSWRWSIMCVNTKVYFDNEKYAKIYYPYSPYYKDYRNKLFNSKFGVEEGFRPSAWKHPDGTPILYPSFHCKNEWEEKMFSYLYKKDKCRKLVLECSRWELIAPLLDNSQEKLWQISSHIFEWWNCYLDN